jgi:hypothetical protein
MNGANVALRNGVYALLITAAAAAVAGRIMDAELVYEPSVDRAWPAQKPRAMPSFGSNDRSRWATVRALVDGDPAHGQPPGTYVIGRRGFGPTQGSQARLPRVVLASAVAPLAASNGLEEAVLAVAAFKARKDSDRGIIFEDGWQSVDKVLDPDTFEFYSSKPPLLATLMAGLYWLLQQLTGWTLASQPFLVIRTLLLLVNGIPFVLYLVLFARLVERYGRTDWGKIFVMGGACFATFATTFAVTFNNHSLATYAVVFALYPAVRILGGLNEGWHWYVLAGFFAGFTACCELPATAYALSLFGILFWWAPRPTLAFFVPASLLPVAAFFVTNYVALGNWRPVQSDFGSPWYDYEGSHWRNTPGYPRRGIDWARTQETRGEYAFHVLLGHHGLLSLTPLWLLAIWGMVCFSRSDLRFWIARGPPRQESTIPALLAAMTLALTVVVVAFYLIKTDNYGGWTSGLRWLMWLSPLWLLTVLPVADRLAGHRWGRGLGYVLLAVSIFSVSFPAWNPWRHPWLYRLMEACGWKSY